MRLIIVSGLSGSGKTIALHMLEDLNYYCIDNLPAGLLPSFIAETVKTREPIYGHTAVGMDARNHPDEIAAVPRLVQQLRDGGVDCELIFLHADEDVLLKRFSETRRRHPLTGRAHSLREAIAREAELLEPIRVQADLVLDTTRTNVHELREIVRDRVDRRHERGLSLLFESFAYKRGLPGDADFVFDVRSLPNPYWIPTLRQLTGRDAPVVEFLESQESVRAMLAELTAFFERWIPEFERTNRSYLTVALGCTGGQHRSVFLVERLAQHFRQGYTQVMTRHNELPG